MRWESNRFRGEVKKWVGRREYVRLFINFDFNVVKGTGWEALELYSPGGNARPPDFLKVN